MKDNLSQDQLVLCYLSFHQVALHGGFRAAADASGVSKSVISLRVQALERHLRTKLLQRSTRSLRLTAAGELFFADCEKLAQQLKQIRAAIPGEGPLRGRLKISAPVDLCAAWLSAALVEFGEGHPALSIELLATDEVLEFEKEGIDLSFRVDARSQSHLFQQKLGDVPFGLFCSRAAPVAQATLENRLAFLEERGVVGILPRAAAITLGKRKVSLHANRRLKVNSILAAKGLLLLPRANEAMLLPRFTVAAELARGEVVDLFPGAAVMTSAYFLISDRKFDEDRRLRELVPFLKQRWRDL